jgi:hypothetical protein
VHLRVKVELLDILKVKNAYVQSVHCVTERAIFFTNLRQIKKTEFRQEAGICTDDVIG